jgi:hypothetical protein
MNRNKVIALILDQLSMSPRVTYVSLGSPTITLSDTIISLEFLAKAWDFNGTVNFYSRDYEPLELKAQNDNHSTLFDNSKAKRYIDDDLERINNYINNCKN